MLDFPEDFFQAEEREGFLVDATMKTVWAAEMEVLQEIAIICNRHNLTWYAAYGTLLGAVRHGGYIPWDDDLDIMMLREDYMKLLPLLQEELPEGYIVKCPMLEGQFPEYYCSVQNSGRVSDDPETLRRFHGCPFMVPVDIFPLDYVHRDPVKREYVRTLVHMIWQAVETLRTPETEGREELLEKIFRTLERECNVQIGRLDKGATEKELTTQLWHMANNLVMSCKKWEGSQLAMYLNLYQGIKPFEKRWFDEVVYLDFEQVCVPVPKEYDAVLRTIYGDYTVRKKNLAQHGYPFYKKQIEILRARLQRMETEAARKESGAGC